MGNRSSITQGQFDQLSQQISVVQQNQVPFFDLSGAFQAQKNYVKNLPNRPDTDTTVKTSLTNVQTNLDNLYSDFLQASGTSSAVLDHQTQMDNIVTTEYDRLVKKKALVDDAVEGQKRMVKLNDSYRKKYSYYVKIILLVIGFLIIIIGINLFSKAFPAIPSYVFDILYFFLVVTLIFTIYFIYLDIIWRDNMNFDELTFNPPPTTDPAAIAAAQRQASKMGDLLGSINIVGCVGNNCCDPATSIWDSGNSVCKGIQLFSSMGDVSIGGQVMPNHATEAGYAKYE